MPLGLGIPTISTVVSTIATVIGLLEAPPGSALARVTPEVATPGEELVLAFSVTTNPPVEATLGERITCTVVAPSGAVASPCDLDSALLSVRLLDGSTREFSFTYVAPSELGTYRVHFEATSLLTIPSTLYVADATFQVIPLTPPSDGGAGDPDPSNVGDPPPADAGGRLTEFVVPTSDEARLLVSSTTGLAVVAVSLIARRWGMVR